MFKTLIFGFLLGIVGTVAAAYYLPVVDQYREPSVILVAPNGGNVETFHVNVPMDRIMIGAPNQSDPLPPGMDWPEDEILAGVRAELFKIRNSRDSVVGVASRVAAESAEFGGSIEWVLHLPARGSFYVSMMPQSLDVVSRVGQMTAGTREFQSLHGSVTERWAENTDDEDEDAPTGRIEIVTMFVGEFSDDDEANDLSGENVGDES
jgi:hypothetical protein